MSRSVSTRSSHRAAGHLVDLLPDRPPAPTPSRVRGRRRGCCGRRRRALSRAPLLHVALHRHIRRLPVVRRHRPVQLVRPRVPEREKLPGSLVDQDEYAVGSNRFRLGEPPVRLLAVTVSVSGPADSFPSFMQPARTRAARRGVRQRERRLELRPLVGLDQGARGLARARRSRRSLRRDFSRCTTRLSSRR
jgi:hypothetical protein